MGIIGRGWLGVDTGWAVADTGYLGVDTGWAVADTGWLGVEHLVGRAGAG